MEKEYNITKLDLQNFLNKHSLTIDENDTLIGLEKLSSEEICEFQNLNERVKKEFLRRS